MDIHKICGHLNTEYWMNDFLFSVNSTYKNGWLSWATYQPCYDPTQDESDYDLIVQSKV